MDACVYAEGPGEIIWLSNAPGPYLPLIVNFGGRAMVERAVMRIPSLLLSTVIVIELKFFSTDFVLCIAIVVRPEAVGIPDACGDSGSGHLCQFSGRLCE